MAASIVLEEETSTIEEYHNVLKDIMDAFWDMSPLEYAKSRGLTSMSDEEGEKILHKARKLLDSSRGGK